MRMFRKESCIKVGEDEDDIAQTPFGPRSVDQNETSKEHPSLTPRWRTLLMDIHKCKTYVRTNDG